MSFNIIETLNFISSSQIKTGEPFKCHCQIKDGFVKSTNGIFTIGSVFPEGIETNPHTLKLIDALRAVDEDFDVESFEDFLKISDKRLTVKVPSIKSSYFPEIEPNEPKLDIDENFKNALKFISPLSCENSQNASYSSLLIRSGSCCSYSGTALIEYWHGLHLPELVIPKRAIIEILKCNKEFSKLGFSDDACTFWFKDGSYFRTQLFQRNVWPDVDKVLNFNANPIPFDSKSLKIAILKILPFCEKGSVYIDSNGVYSDREDNLKRTSFLYETGISSKFSFNGDVMLKVINEADSIDFSEMKIRFFAGDLARSLIVGIK